MRSIRIKPKKNERSVAKDAVNKVLGVVGFEPDKFALFEVWERESQSFIKGCEAVAIQGKRLCVKVPSVVHRQEILYSKERLIKKVNQAMGQTIINDIRFELSTERSAQKTYQPKGGTLSGEHPIRQWNRRFGKRHGE